MSTLASRQIFADYNWLRGYVQWLFTWSCMVLMSMVNSFAFNLFALVHTRSTDLYLLCGTPPLECRACLARHAECRRLERSGNKAVQSARDDRPQACLFAKSLAVFLLASSADYADTNDNVARRVYMSALLLQVVAQYLREKRVSSKLQDGDRISAWWVISAGEY